MKKSNRPQKITDQGDAKKYFFVLPNLYDDLDLDPHEYRLLGHYKRVGHCYEGVHTTARKTCMSTGKVSEARRSLADKGLIALRERRGGGFDVTVRDIWKENIAHYAMVKSSLSKPALRQMKLDLTLRARPSRGETPLHQVKPPFITRNPPSPGEPPFHQVKERSTQLEEPIKKKQRHSKIRMPSSSQENSDPVAPTERYSQAIERFMVQLSKIELRDRAHTNSNISNALNRWRESRLDETRFIELLQKAKTLTLNHTAMIRPRDDPQKNRAPYFFAVLNDLLRQAILDSPPISQRARTPIPHRGRTRTVGEILKDLPGVER